MIENFVVANEFYNQLDADDIFALEDWSKFKKNGPYPKIEPYSLVKEDFSILDLLVAINIFSSKSQARKNWKGPVEIPSGYTEFKSLGKFKRNLYVLKPIYFDPYAYSD